MDLIYQEEGNGAKSYPIENGSVATWWTGHEFDLDGRHYYTGFATSTPEKFGNNRGRTTRGVTLAEATFELAHPGAPRPWAFLHAQNWMGEIGFREQAPAIDPALPVVEHRFSTGLLLLAVPIVEGEGLVQRSYAILRYSAKSPEDVVNDRRWLYLGSVAAGEDNTAQCRHEHSTCAQWIGRLELRNGSRGLPDIIMHRSGTETDDQTGLARKLGNHDRSLYVYDSQEKMYRSR